MKRPWPPESSAEYRQAVDKRGYAPSWTSVGYGRDIAVIGIGLYVGGLILFAVLSEVLS